MLIFIAKKLNYRRRLLFLLGELDKFNLTSHRFILVFIVLRINKCGSSNQFSDY